MNSKQLAYSIANAVCTLNNKKNEENYVEILQNELMNLVQETMDFVSSETRKVLNGKRTTVDRK